MDKNSFYFRTDMADEAGRLWLGKSGDRGEIPGVSLSKSQFFGMELTEIKILNEEGEAALSKPRGRYYSLTLPESFDRGSEFFSGCAQAVSELILRCGADCCSTVLVAALGNPDITPDALGNLAASSILVTAHLDRKQFPQFSSLCLCRPGVLGTSGIESAEQIKALCALTKPDLVIVIDAMAGSDAERLCRCIQISDAGISPGSGVGNDRQELSRESLGVPVISLGMPTVIDASYLGAEDYSGMFVTPRNIDSLVRSGAKLIGYGIDLAVHRGLRIEDIDALVF